MGLLLCPASTHAQVPPDPDQPPNIVLIFADDLGYNDLSSFGANRGSAAPIQTPHLDAIAAAGVKLTSFYVSSPICSPSRAALLTGRYPSRTGVTKVIFPGRTGLPAEEVTLAEGLSAAGYATALVGKWHLGDDQDGNLSDFPTLQGFDTFFGLPYSNDMEPFVLMRGTQVIEQPTDQATLLQRYTDEALRFIERQHNAGQPFFLYMPHSAPHVPVVPSPAFEGVSGQGAYGDVVMELDWSVGQVIGQLRRLGIEDETIVLFTSDNGPSLAQGPAGGTAHPLRGGKRSVREGGVRVPFVAQWPGVLPAGLATDEPASTVDLFTTLLKVAGATEHIPTDRAIDGLDIWAILTGTSARPWPHLFFYGVDTPTVKAMRHGRWKGYAAGPGGAVDELYDLTGDAGEDDNLADDEQAVSEHLEQEIEAFVRQRSTPTVRGVTPVSYTGTARNGVTLARAAVGASYLTDQPSRTLGRLPQAYEGSVLIQYAAADASPGPMADPAPASLAAFGGPAHDPAAFKAFHAFAAQANPNRFITLATMAKGEAVVGYDARAPVLPDWLASWMPSGHTLTVRTSEAGTEDTFALYTRPFGVGDIVALGPVGAGDAPYVAMMAVADRPGAPGPENRSFFVRSTYPNPASTHVTMLVATQEAATATVEVFDLLGRRVVRTVPSFITDGTSESIIFDVQRLPAGLYLYRVTAGMASGTETDTGRFTIVR